jgi:TRAP-type C4-dicarboxylate transport system permease small subunit
MSLIVIVQVFSRYLFNHSFVWAEELVRYLMIWMVLIGAALVQSKNGHIRIDFFPRMAGPRGGRIMETVFRLCTLLFLTVIVFKGVESAHFNRLFESSGLRIPMLWPYLAIPIGGALIGIYTAVALVRDLVRLFTWSGERLAAYDRRGGTALDEKTRDRAEHGPEPAREE